MHRFLSILFVFSALVASSQRLIGADAIFTNTAVVVRFTLAGGTSCSAYSILHCTDSVSFQSIYEGGQCAATNEPLEVVYAHTGFVSDVVNYYKVRLDAWENSATIRIFPSKTGRSGLTLYPNPMGISDNLLHLRALGTDNTKLYGFLYNRFGAVQNELYFQTSGDAAQLSLGSLDQGVYVLWLTDGNNVYSSKFIVLR